jgi:hypothetical protein
MADKNRQKPKEERVSESVNLLKQLRDLGVVDSTLGYEELKEQIKEWVTTGKRWEGTITFPTFRRKAEIILPFKANQAASLNFKVIKYGF